MKETTNMTILKEYQRLLMRREGSSVTGRHAINLWLLVIVLTTTFLAIAFSAGSMDYLNDKMNDPFTNWVNINTFGASKSEGENYIDVSALKDSLSEESIRQRYGFDGWQTEVLSSINIDCKDGKSYFSCSTLYYEDMGSDFIKAVLSEENVVEQFAVSHDSIGNSSIGLISTLENLEKLGYGIGDIPSYLGYHSHSPGADTLGFHLSETSYGRAPLPLLAVVRRLPMNMEMIGSKYLYMSYHSGSSHPPFDLNDRDYARELRFFVPDGLDFNQERVNAIIPSELRSFVSNVQQSETRVQDQLRNWRHGKVWMVYLRDASVPFNEIGKIEQSLLSTYASEGVERVYNYKLEDVKNSASALYDNIISVHFTRLDSIRAFENYVKRKAGLQIELTQVKSKENFNAVSVMAIVLSAAMLVFAIVSIIIFIVNMMQSYFQKVKRNLGTFKAFGLSTNGLITVYVLIIIGIVCTALAVAIGVVWIVQAILPIRDGQFSYLLLWNTMTLWAVVIILVSAIVSVLVVMRRLLRQTPGDLIYDR